MYEPDGSETLYHLRRGEEELRIAVDDETFAHLLNDGWEVIEETLSFSRLPVAVYDTNVPEELRITP